MTTFFPDRTAPQSAAVIALLFGPTGTISPQPSAIVAATPPQECAHELIEEMRIGSLGGTTEYSFSDINSIAVAQSGAIYVDDSHPPSIRRFDPDGRFVRWIGREGEGPGEFLSIAGISVLPDGRLAAWDRRGRITVYGTDGEYDEIVRVELENPWGYPFVDRAFLTDSSGRYYVRIFASSPSGSDPLEVAGIRYGYARLSPDGSILDTVTAPRDERREVAESIVIHTRAGDRHPFPRETLEAVSPFGYLVAGHNGTYTFSILDPSGTIEVEREGFERVELKTEERAEWRARVAFAERRSGVSFRDVPARKPAYRDLWVDADGRIWVHRYAEAVKRSEPIPELWLEDPEGNVPRITWAEPTSYDVFGPDGQLLHCVRIPDDAEVAASRGSLAWGILRGALDEEYVVRWRMK